jgi:outer membrane protein assembly factor BamB
MSRGKLVILLGLLTLPTFGADGASWRQYGFDNTHFSRQPSETDLNAASVATLHVDWDFSIPFDGRTDSFSASPSVDDNTVYIGGRNGIFYAIFATGPLKGTIRWRYPPVVTPPPDACGTTTTPLLIGGGENPSGDASGPGIASSAAIVDNVAGHTVVIFGAPDPTSNRGDGRLWALDTATGQCIWKSTVLAPTGGTSKIGYSSPAIAHGRAYIGVSAKNPDDPITIGKLFAIDLNTGSVDPAFNFAAMGSPAGGGIWSSPAVTPSGNIVFTTGNSCNNTDSTVDCSSAIPALDRSLSMVKVDSQNGNVLQQLQPVDVHVDHDPDWAASPIVGQVSCGTLSMSVQKDGYLHALEIMTGGPFPPNPACSYPGHSLDCPRWTFPTVPSLPFEDDGHGDNMDAFGNRLIHPGALDGDHLFIATGGLNLTELFVTNRLYSLNVCASDLNRSRWILDVDGAVGSPSVANGVIYVGTSTGRFYAIADTDVLPPLFEVCDYPNVIGENTCTAGHFKMKPVPRIVSNPDAAGNGHPILLEGSIPGIPAIANGAVYVATTLGHLYRLVK